LNSPVAAKYNAKMIESRAQLEEAFLDLPEPLQGRLDRCVGIVADLQRLLVAFSGGVDSTFLLATAAAVLGPENVLAAVGVSPSLAGRELSDARRLAGQLGVRLVEIETGEMDQPDYAANTPDRCFHCKTVLLTRLNDLAEAENMVAVATGANADDLDDYRPGLLAAERLGVVNPLMEAGLTKADLRRASRALGLPTWDKPACACLASRIPYGRPITPEALSRIDRAEEALREAGFVGCRVRDHGDIARIEVPPARIDDLAAARDRIVGPLKELGYTYVTADLQGYRTGSLNETIGD
jgi:uncharacterized protein